MKALTAILALSLLWLAAPARAAGLTIVSQGPTRGGWEYVVRSAAAGRDFRVQVAEPDRFPWARSRLPAIYVLDGDALFAPAARTALNLAQEHRMAPAYVVAVGYPVGTRVQTERLYDLVHAQTQWGGRTIGGRGGAFQRFLVEELQPFIARRYKVDNARSVLAGHSVGGLFAATVMASDLKAFGGYLLGSPSLAFDMGLIGKLAAMDGGGRRILIAVGSGEDAGMIAGADRLAASLGGAGATFKVDHQVLPGSSHVQVMSRMMAPGFAFLLPPKDGR